MALFLLAACTGRPIGRENARDYFASHRAEFERLLKQVEACEPPTGRLDRSSHFECAAEEGDHRSVIDAMISTGATWIRINYGESDDQTRHVSRMFVVTYSEGMSFAGIMEAFVYEAEPTAEAQYERNDDGVADVQHMPVTEAPHHWYWQHTRRR